MSHSCDERYDVYEEQLRTAAKTHDCDCCDEPILKGDRYYSVSWVFQKTAGRVKRCLRCQVIHVELRGWGEGETWPAEKLDCGETFEEHFGRPAPDNLARLAFLTHDEIQSQLLADASP